MTKYEEERKSKVDKWKEPREYYGPFADRNEMIGGVRYNMLPSPSWTIS